MTTRKAKAKAKAKARARTTATADLSATRRFADAPVEMTVV
jgi:hypothetical protein